MAKSSNKKKEAAVAQLDQGKNPSLKFYYYFFAFISFVLFANSLSHGYNMDDTMVTNFHPLTSQGLSAIAEIFTSPYYSDDMGYAYGYRPMVHLSFALEHELFGQSAGAGHFINVMLFTTCVLLFFKLLLKWFGTKNLIYVAIATLLFAVHPIHTEVVNSLKNRDELLAFLFIISAGLSLNKFLEKGKIFSLIGIFLFTIAAMLSKKSTFPFAVLLPIIYVFLNKINLKQLMIVGSIIVIPTSIIGADAMLGRSFILLAVSTVAIAGSYYLLNQILKNDEEKKDIKKDTSWILPCLGFATTFAIYTFINNPIALIVSTIFLVWVFKSNYKFAMVLSILALFFAPNNLTFIDTNQLLLFLSAGYASYLYHQKEPIRNWLPLIILGATLYLIQAPYFISLAYLFVVILLAYLVFLNQVWALIFAIICCIGYYFFTNSFTPYMLVIIGMIGTIYFNQRKSLVKNWLPWVPIVSVVLLFFFQIQKEISNKIYNENIVATEIGSTNNLGNTSSGVIDSKKGTIAEGRQLQYVENTLVVRHTAAERIATGFYTLGTYLKLHLYPVELSFYYGYSKIKTMDFSSPSVWISILFHLLIAVLGLLSIKKRPIIAIGVMWYFASILLFSNWVELVAGMVGERLAFIASGGFALIIAGIIAWIAPKLELKKMGIVGIGVLIIAALFAVRTFNRNKDWKDTYTLMHHDIAHLEQSAQANNMYAMTLMQLSNPAIQKNPAIALSLQEEAIRHFEKSLEIAPDYFNVHVNLGRAAMITQSYEKAITAFDNAIEIEPQYFAPYNHLLEIYNVQKNQQMYAQTAKKLFDITKEPRTYILYAMGEFQLGNKKKSKEILEEGLKSFPDDAAILQNLKALE